MTGKWFTHGADSYVRTRERVPLSRVEKAIPVDKTWVSRIPQRQREIGE